MLSVYPYFAYGSDHNSLDNVHKKEIGHLIMIEPFFLFFGNKTGVSPADYDMHVLVN
jgi:hypothetical protein